MIMEAVLKTVGIKKLKNSLSAYLQEVQRGVRILVTDRDRVVAEIAEPSFAAPPFSKHPGYERLVREGKLRPALKPRVPGSLEKTGFRLKKGPSPLEVLEELRGED